MHRHAHYTPCSLTLSSCAVGVLLLAPRSPVTLAPASLNVTAILAGGVSLSFPQFSVGRGGIIRKASTKLTSEFTLQIKHGRDEQKQKALQRAEATGRSPHTSDVPGKRAGSPATSPPPGATSYEAHPFSVLIVVLPKHLLLPFHNASLHLL